MKILIINTSETDGGAARAAYRLHESLLMHGIDSNMLVQKRSSNSIKIYSPKSFFYKYLIIFKSIFDFLPLIFYPNRQKQIFSTSWMSSPHILRIINKIKPDIIHLHWINEGLLSLHDLEKIKFPIVWTLHDNWAFTGGCHVKWDCQNFLTSCGKCPNLNSNFLYDLSWINFKRKNNTYSKIKNNVTIICLSKWLESNARQSKLLSDFKIINLPNPINTSIFNSLNKKFCRELFGIPQNKKVLLFGALNPISDKNKGFLLLKESLKHIKHKDIVLVIFGMSENEQLNNLEIDIIRTGVLRDDITIKLLYNASDVFLVPSLQENLSNSIMESMSCGLPVVAFDTGGNSDLIKHSINGYLASKFETIDFANGIMELLNDEIREEYSMKARQFVIDNYDYTIIANKYVSLYNTILNKNEADNQ